MSLDPPAYLNSLQHNIRARPIPWEGAVRAGHISDVELKKIKAVDKVRKEQRKQTVEGDLQAYRTLLLGAEGTQSVLESAKKRADVIQYILVLAGDLMNDVPSFTSYLLEHPDPYRPFLPLLDQSASVEDPIPLLTSSVLTNMISKVLMTSKYSSKINDALDKLYRYLSNLSKSQDSGLQDIAVQEYSSLLRTTPSRELFWAQRKDTVDPLIDILRSAAGAGKDTDSTLVSGGAASIRTTTDIGLGGGVGLQLLYHVLLVLWQLSFEAVLVGRGLQEDHDLITLYTNLLRLSPKEKTTRLLLSTMHNLVSDPTNRTALLPAAVLARLPSLLTNLGGRHFTDPDLLDDLQALQAQLDEYARTHTTFDEYAAELQSGHLRWSPPHRSPTFWAENARRILDEDRGALPRKLAEIMGKSWETDRQVLAIACNDVGNLVREVPERRGELEKYGLKARVMELMGNSDESVRWESLRAVGEWLRYSFNQK